MLEGRRRAILEDEFECMLVNARHVKQATLAIGQERRLRRRRIRAPALAEREQQALRRATRLLLREMRASAANCAGRAPLVHSGRLVSLGADDRN